MQKYIILLCSLLLLLIIFVDCDSYEPPESLGYPESEITSRDENGDFRIPEHSMESGVLEVSVFGLQSADSILLTTENYVVLIDTGERQHGRSIAERLFDRNIFHIDYLIITHFDRDHVGGAYDIIRFLGVNNVIVPNYRRISNSVRRFEEAKQRVGLEAHVLTETITLTLDDAVFVIYPTDLDFFVFGNEYDDGNDLGVDLGSESGITSQTGDTNNTDSYEVIAPRENDFSIIVTVAHGENNFIFTGDAMAERLGMALETEEIIDIDFDFLKLPHHGRHNRRSVEFINAINPRYAVSTCCIDRPTDARVIAALESVGAEIFFSKNGIVHARSDGRTLAVTQ